MLVNHGMLEGKMPKAWHEEIFRKAPDQFSETAFADYEKIEKAQAVVDETDRVLGVVSGRHTIVDNRELVSALDVAAANLGLTVEPTGAVYHNGKARYSFKIPELTFQVKGDPSKTSGKLDLRNNHAGNGGLGVDSGYWRWKCSNGMVAGKILHAATLRHVGEIDVYGFVQRALEKVKDEFDVQVLVAETLANDRCMMIGVDSGREENVRRVNEPGALSSTIVDQIIADTSERYDPYLRNAIRENAREMGNNLWALAQAVSQTSTHRMPGMNADQWATRQLNRIREFAGV